MITIRKGSKVWLNPGDTAILIYRGKRYMVKAEENGSCQDCPLYRLPWRECHEYFNCSVFLKQLEEDIV